MGSACTVMLSVMLSVHPMALASSLAGCETLGKVDHERGTGSMFTWPTWAKPGHSKASVGSTSHQLARASQVTARRQGAALASACPPGRHVQARSQPGVKQHYSEQQVYLADTDKPGHDGTFQWQWQNRISTSMSSQ